MSDKADRRWRMEQLLHKNKSRQKSDYGELFKECVEALGDGTTILSEEQSNAVFDTLQSSFPFTIWSRIDWDKVSMKMGVDSASYIMQILNNYGEANSSVFVLWSYGNYPVIEANMYKILNAIEDVTAVSDDTYIFCPSKFVIEFYHEGEVTIGFLGR